MKTKNLLLIMMIVMSASHSAFAGIETLKTSYDRVLNQSEWCTDSKDTNGFVYQKQGIRGGEISHSIWSKIDSNKLNLMTNTTGVFHALNWDNKHPYVSHDDFKTIKIVFVVYDFETGVVSKLDRDTDKTVFIDCKNKQQRTKNPLECISNGNIFSEIIDDDYSVNEENPANRSLMCAVDLLNAFNNFFIHNTAELTN